MLVVINLIMAYNNYIKCLHTQAHTHKYTRAHTYTYTDNFITVQRSLFHIPKSQYRSHPFMTSTQEPSIYDVHTEEEGVRPMWTHVP